MTHDALKAELDAVETVLAAAGIAPDFINYDGQQQCIALSHRLAVLASMGCDLRRSPETPWPAESDFDLQLLCPERLQQALNDLRQQPWRQMLPAWQVLQPLQQGFSLEIGVNVPEEHLEETWYWQLFTESGQCLSGEFQPQHLVQCRHSAELSCRTLCLHWPTLEAGYHRLRITDHRSHQAESALLAAPAQAWQPQTLWQRRSWGVSVQLYSVASERNWGIGDFSDLKQLVTLFAACGADFLLLNPLHANALHQPQHCSPYSPADRRWLNPLYIDLEQVPEFQQAPQLLAGLQSPTSRARLHALRQAEWLDYEAVADFKLPLLAALYDQLKSGSDAAAQARRLALEAFIRTGGRALQDHVGWQVERPPVAAGEHATDPDFYAYLQWQASEQLQACQMLAREQGMAIGLIQDLAVGSAVEGSEVQRSAGLFCTAASIGAPPDAWAPQGQDWGLPPWRPDILAQQQFAAFATLLRRNMLPDAALRMDHVMSLARLWWCPRQLDDSGGGGAYVEYPLQALLAVLRLESQRQRCLVIGEDLGVVPPALRESLQQAGVLSNLLFYFEKTGDQFRSPDHHPPAALAMLANHDVPPLQSWWQGSDLHLRSRLGLMADAAQLQQALAQRAAGREQLLALLESQWLLPADRFDEGASERALDEALLTALLRCLGRSQSRLVSVQLEDLLLLDTPVNVPGTSSEYPNWQRRLPLDLLLRLQSESVQRLLEALHGERT